MTLLISYFNRHFRDKGRDVYNTWPEVIFSETRILRMLMLDCHCVVLASETSTRALWRCGENLSSQLHISSKKLIY